MLRLLTLGGLSLADEEGAQAQALLRRPKWVTFLCVLAVARGWVARQTLLALLWPDLDESHARHALRQTLSEVNAVLPPHTLASEAGAGLMADKGRLWCDAASLYEAARGGRHQEVRELYGGEFLPGFSGMSHSRALEDWLERHRRELRTHAFRSTWALAVSAEEEGRVVPACHLAVEAADLHPHDETVLRQALRLLARLGDPPRAYELFRRFRERMRADLDMEPSGATLALAEAIRAGKSASS